MCHLNNSVKRILYYLGIVIIFLVILIYQSGFYHDVTIEFLAESNTNEIRDEPNSEKDFSWMIAPWAKYSHNPILTTGDYEWESKNVLNPIAIVKDGKVYLFYRAQNDKRVSCVGLAISDDGYNFEKQNEPVLVPTEKY